MPLRSEETPLRDLSIRLAGQSIRIETNCASARTLIRKLYPPARSRSAVASFALREDTGLGGARYSVCCPNGAGRRVFRYQTLAGALNRLEAQVCDLALNAGKSGVTLHGALLQKSSGQGLLLAGRSGAGKSTLAVASAAFGFTPLSDDAVVLDPVANVLEPIPRCFHLDARSKRLLLGMNVQLPEPAASHDFVTPAHMGAERGAPLRPCAIVFLGRSPERFPQVREVAQAETAARLLEESGFRGLSRQAVIEAVGRLVAEARCFWLGRARLSDSARELERLYQLSVLQ